MNMKNVRVIVIAVVCILVICGGFFLFSQNLNSGNPDELTEVEKVLVKDLKKDYPKTPREVVKLYNEIITCFYGEEYTEEELEKLVDMTLVLMDEELAANNPRENYLKKVKMDVR